MNTAYFNHFSLSLTDDAVALCSHAGACDGDVYFWQNFIDRPDACTAAVLAAELKEYGAWDEAELADDTANWRRIIWIAACNINDERRERNYRGQ